MLAPLTTGAQIQTHHTALKQGAYATYRTSCPYRRHIAHNDTPGLGSPKPGPKPALAGTAVRPGGSHPGPTGITCSSPADRRARRSTEHRARPSTGPGSPGPTSNSGAARTAGRAALSAPARPGRPAVATAPATVRAGLSWADRKNCPGLPLPTWGARHPDCDRQPCRPGWPHQCDQRFDSGS